MKNSGTGNNESFPPDILKKTGTNDRYK